MGLGRAGVSLYGAGVSGRVTIAEIMADLAIGKPAVYRMLGDRVIPNIRVGQKFIVTRAAYDAWKQRCGTDQASVQLQHAHSQAQN